VFFAAGVGMLISLVWFYIGRKTLQGHRRTGRPNWHRAAARSIAVIIGSVIVIPGVYFLLKLGADTLQGILSVLFIALAVMLMVEGIRNGKVARDKTIAMMIIFVFNILFWCFFEQAGSSFTFLADQIVDRDLGGWIFPTAWFQSVNSIAIIVFAPIIAAIWVMLGRRNANPSIPRKFGLGLIFNGLAFGLLMYALSTLVDMNGKIPFWTLFTVYFIQSVGELCLSPIGLSMVTKLAPTRLVGLGMGGWFLSTGIGNNLSGIFASMGVGRNRHVGRLGAGRLHLRLLVAGGRRRAAVPDRTADPEADAWREVSSEDLQLQVLAEKRQLRLPFFSRIANTLSGRSRPGMPSRPNRSAALCPGSRWFL
jgi:POT family proton-dependent oligopeptide transporter